jgi:hypothetical protein
MLKNLIKVRRLIFKQCYLRILHISDITIEGSRAEGWGTMPLGEKTQLFLSSHKFISRSGKYV